MEYTDKEKQILSFMERTDFKNLSKSDLFTYASKLNELRPEVAAQVIAQFPELVNLTRSSLTEYKGILDSVIASDDASLKLVYDIINKEMVTPLQAGMSISVLQKRYVLTVANV